jgi:hypothetical protein
VAGDRQLISVRTDVVFSVMVDALYEDACADEPLPADAEEALPLAGDADVARMGWRTRKGELKRFERAHDRPDDRLVAKLTDDRNQIAALAQAEPADRPDPDDPNAVSWQIPGPGGHVRHYVALRCAAEPALKAAWMYGFLLAEAHRLDGAGR